MTPLIENPRISDSFTVLIPGGKADAVGLIAFQFTSRDTGKQTVLQISADEELLRKRLNPAMEAVLVNIFRNYGFTVSVLPGALEVFLHLLQFPEDGPKAGVDVRTEYADLSQRNVPIISASETPVYN